MKKLNIPRIPAAVAFLLAGGVALAQSGGGGGSQPSKADSKPAAVASQAATTAPHGAAAQPSAATPADPVQVTPTTIRAEYIKGSVRTQASDDAAKTIAKEGDKFQQGVRVAVGPFSEVRFLIGDGQSLTFDKLANNYLIQKAVNDGTTDRTIIKMDQGRVSFDVKKVRFANHVLIETPTMTLAITGTSGFVEYIPGQPVIASGAEENHGRIQVEFKDSGQRVTMTRNEMATSVTPEPAAVLSQRAAVDQSSLDAREHDEARLLKRTEGGTQAVPLDLGDVNSTKSRETLMDMIGPGGGTGIGTPGPTGTIHLENPGVGLSRLDGSGTGGDSLSPSTRAPVPSPSRGVSAIEIAAYNARLGRALAAWQARNSDAMDHPLLVAKLLKHRDARAERPSGIDKIDRCHTIVAPHMDGSVAQRK